MSEEYKQKLLHCTASSASNLSILLSMQPSVSSDRLFPWQEVCFIFLFCDLVCAFILHATSTSSKKLHRFGWFTTCGCLETCLERFPKPQQFPHFFALNIDNISYVSVNCTCTRNLIFATIVNFNVQKVSNMKVEISLPLWILLLCWWLNKQVFSNV